MLVNILQHFDYSRYEVTLLYFVKGGVYSSEIPPQVKRVVPFTTGTRLSNFFYLLMQHFGVLNNWYKYCTLKKLERYDAIISYLEGFPLHIHSLILERGKENISFIHTDLSAFPDAVKQLGGEAPCEAAYGLMDNLVFVAQTAKDSFQRLFPDIKNTMTVLPNFIDIDDVVSKGNEYYVERKGITVTCISRLAPVKGIDIIPQISAELRNRGIEVHFYIVGDGSERKHIEELIKFNDVSSYVHLVGYQSNPYPYLKAADIYISTSISEGMPLSFCEAMAYGKPIVASETAGSLYLIDDNIGIIVKRKVSLFVEAIFCLVNDRQKRTAMGNMAREKSKLFGSESYMRALYNLID